MHTSQNMETFMENPERLIRDPWLYPRQNMTDGERIDTFARLCIIITIYVIFCLGIVHGMIFSIFASIFLWLFISSTAKSNCARLNNQQESEK